MALKTLIIKFRSSGTAGNIPTTAQITAAEPAINLADKKLYSSDGSSVFQVAPSMAEHNAKEAGIAGGAATQYWRGTKVWADFATDVRAAVLTGLSTASSAAIAATDTVIVALGKIQAQLNLHAPLASPAFTGTPTAPTAAAGTSTTQIASTAYVRNEIAALAGSAPAVLDTLGEIATALGNDPNFAASITGQLAGKEAAFDTISGGTF
ncbi:hypothetical protein [Rhizobium sp.]|uniref:hypothetical protein n=1 Tax=Rhizobium sp. TaxID=391 RepID=UPI003F81CEA0